jgi:predicted metal-dependent phosphoesterase TrpH
MKHKKVDLHLHTDASDGSWGVDQLLKIIKEKNISIFSITDHDSINNVKAMQNKCENQDFRFIPGVEISATLNNKEYHIAAYCYNFKNKKLTSILNSNRKVRIDFNRNIIKFFEVEYEKELINEYYDYQHNLNRGGWKSLNFLMDKGLVKDLEDFFRKIYSMNEEMVFLSPKEVIDVIHEAGGYAFLAHPASYFNGDLLETNFLKDWLKFGIDGIEVYSPYLNNLNDADYYIEFCNTYELMYSSGSDCHGDFIKERKVGKPKIYLLDIKIDNLLK